MKRPPTDKESEFIARKIFPNADEVRVLPPQDADLERVEEIEYETRTGALCPWGGAGKNTP